MTRTVPAMRIQLLIWRRTQLIPWAALALSLAVNLGIFAFVPPSPSGHRTTGGLATIYGFPLAFAVQSIVQTFPFAAGLGITRRAYASSVAVLVTAQGVLWGVLLFLLSLLEGATGGFGESLEFFRVPAMLTGDRATQLLVYIAPLVLSGFLGFLIGAVIRRFGVYGLLTGALGVVVAGGLVAVLVSWQHRWSPLLGWFGDRDALTAVVGLSAVLALLSAGGGWAVLRRAPA